MKNFEQNYVRAVDGELGDPEVEAAIRQELERCGEAADSIEVDRAFLSQFSRGARTVEMKNGDFFSHQVLSEIRRLEGSEHPAVLRQAGRLPLWLRLATGGALILAVALVMTLALQPYDRESEIGMTTRVLAVHTFADGIDATPITTADDHYAVVWVSGLDFLPENYRIQ